MVARELEFAAISANSMDAVADRDFAIEYLASASIAFVHISRLCEDLILWSTQEFGFVELPDAFATGSSMMPQKKNPDVAELSRGRSGKVFGALVSLLTTMKGLPLTYNRDLQEDKEPLFAAHDTLIATLAILADMLPQLRFRRLATRRAAGGPLLATDIADYLVGKGMPFREAHEVVGRLVAYCEVNRKSIDRLGIADYRKFSPLFEEDIARLDVWSSLRARNVPGGTAPTRVSQSIRRARTILRRREAEA
jgi:argininosuccinate lyase